MTDPHTDSVPRSPDEPTPDRVFQMMEPGRCYVAADLVADLEEEFDPSRSTVRRRLNDLADGDRIVKVVHENGTVTYQRPDGE